MIYLLPAGMIAAGAALLLSRYRQREPFSVPLLSDHAKLILAGCLIFFAVCVLFWLLFPDVAAQIAPPRKR